MDRMKQVWNSMDLPSSGSCEILPMKFMAFGARVHQHLNPLAKDSISLTFIAAISFDQAGSGGIVELSSPRFLLRPRRVVLQFIFKEWLSGERTMSSCK
jgi:hypothetical protein